VNISNFSNSLFFSVPCDFLFSKALRGGYEFYNGKLRSTMANLWERCNRPLFFLRKAWPRCPFDNCEQIILDLIVYFGLLHLSWSMVPNKDVTMSHYETQYKCFKFKKRCMLCLLKNKKCFCFLLFVLDFFIYLHTSLLQVLNVKTH